MPSGVEFSSSNTVLATSAFDVNGDGFAAFSLVNGSIQETIDLYQIFWTRIIATMAAPAIITVLQNMMRTAAINMTKLHLMSVM